MEELAKDLWALVVDEMVVHGIRHLVWLVLAGVLMMFFGRKWRRVNRRLEALEEKASLASSGPTMVAHGNIYNFNNKQIAKYTQKFEMLNTTIPLSNGQIITFFIPKITIEYADHDKGSIELPRAKFEEIVQGMERAFTANPEIFKNWERLSVKPEVLEGMAAEIREQKSSNK